MQIKTRKHFLHIGLLSLDNKPCNVCTEGPPPLYISYVIPEETKQDRYRYYQMSFDMIDNVKMHAVPSEVQVASQKSKSTGLTMFNGGYLASFRCDTW